MMNWYVKTLLQALAVGIAAAAFIAGTMAVAMLLMGRFDGQVISVLAWVFFAASTIGIAIGNTIFSDGSPLNR